MMFYQRQILPEPLVFKGITRIAQKEFGAKANNKRKIENLRLLFLYYPVLAGVLTGRQQQRENYSVSLN